MKVLFLDIDGVLQPYDNELRFMDIDKNLIEKLSEKYSTDYSQYQMYDVAAVYYDWDKQAVARVKYILDETNSKIIMSSNWRNEKNIYKMRDLLKIQGLDSYWFADNIIIRHKKGETMASTRAQEIKDSLDRYDIDNFVVLDDLWALKEYYPDNSVITHNVISIGNMNDSIKILRREKK